MSILVLCLYIQETLQGSSPMYIWSLRWFCMAEDRSAVRPLPVPSNDSVALMLSLHIYHQYPHQAGRASSWACNSPRLGWAGFPMQRQWGTVTAEQQGNRNTKEIAFPPNLLCIASIWFASSHHFLQPIPEIPDLAQPMFSVAEAAYF